MEKKSLRFFFRERPEKLSLQVFFVRPLGPEVRTNEFFRHLWKMSASLHFVEGRPFSLVLPKVLSAFFGTK
jgi:hypothetical protein